MPFRVQRKRTSSEAAKERAAVHLVRQGVADSPAPLETTGSLKTRFAQTGSNSYFDRFCGARLHEMANKKSFLEIPIDPFMVNN
jgi:hypothetical protein